MAPDAASDRSRVLLGEIVGVFGVEGWVKVHSYTEPRENLFRYRPWILVSAGGESTLDKPQGRAQGKGLVAKLPGIDDRDAAAALVGAEILVDRARLPKAKEGEFYWSDLEGIEVRLEDGTVLGKVSHLFSTGANDVVVVRGDRERLLPYTADVIKRVDLEAGVLVVDWDPEF